MGKEEGRLTNGSNKTQQGDEHHGHLLFSGTTGILAASTTPYYGGGTFALFFSLLVHSLQADSDGLTSLNPLGLRLFPYARLIPTKLQLRLGRISPLTGFFNIPKIFEGSYREKSEGGFGCIDFIGEDFEVEVKSERYNDYLKRKEGRRRWWRRNDRSNGEAVEASTIATLDKGFPFQHSGESVGRKERFRLRTVKKPVKFVSFVQRRPLVMDD